MTERGNSKISIFIVEDFDLLRDGLRASINKEDDMECVGEAADGLTAVHKVASVKPAVVIMDIGLPQMDGIAATREIRRQVPETKVVMLTSHDDDTEIFAAFASGASGYCMKDTASQTLKLAIRSVHQGAAWFDPRIASRLLNEMVTGNQSQPTIQPLAKTPDCDLSEREIDVLKLITEGLGNKEIATRLKINASTVRTHVEHILEKLCASGRTDAAVKALRLGLVD
jgi:DNA-binding NarL/FixJ family response regulator